MKFTALLLIGAAALANAGPVARDTCATICDIAPGKFMYKPGTTYVYDYEGETITKVEGASEEVSGLHVKTTARIHVLSKCEMQLELRGTELSHLAPSDATAKTASPVGGAFKNELEANAVRFGMNNGKVERVCGGVKDAAWVLNIKKAIISALQNNMADLKTETTIRESDVVGTCDTVYKTMADGSIVKTKNLLGCIDREHMNTMIQHAHYMVPSDIQGVPFLKSEHTCKQVVAGGKITAVTCTESHIARAFSNGAAGAATTLKTKLTFKEAVAENVAPKPVAFTSPIIFDAMKTEREIKDAANFVKGAIAEICAAGHVEDKSAERFAKLIKNVQALDLTTLTKIHQEVRAAKICKLGVKTFHDVLPLAGTTPAVSVMKDILLAGEIAGTEEEMWKTALAFIPNPTEEMIAHVTPLLAKPDRKVYLSLSTMVRNFCLKREDCAAVKEVQDFIKVLESHIGTDCTGAEDVVLMSLKAIGNAGVILTGKPALVKCIKNEKISMDLRIASLEAFRHMKLGATTKTALIEIYKNMDLDPEIRIGAFVALMRDPCKMCIDAVQATMAKERVLQVGSFVVSYMENARRADNPMKKDIITVLRMFDETKIKRDWNLERMKYSRAYEASYFSSYLNAGIDAESHVIFSQAGFLPRQVKTNLNINLFGRSVNLLEVGARMEGLENILEYYFGPKGPLAESGVGRTKRAVLDNGAIDKIHEKVKSQSVLKEARGLMYLKMFGSELGYANFDLETILKKKDGINVLEMLKSIAKNHEQEYTQNFQLLDLTYTIPTVLGLPLKLDLNAHGTMHLKMGGKLDIVKLMQPPRNLDIDGYIKPSAAIEVRTEMGIDAFHTQTGIKMVANLHTATSVEGKVLLKDGKIFKVHYAVPKTEQEIFHGMTKFFVKHHNTEREQRMITQDAITMSKCSGETLAAITGLEMCGEIRLPNAAMVKTAPYFPLTGPVNMRLAIAKKDAKLTSYDFEASRTSVDGVEALKLILDTPGSETNRELSTIVSLNTVAKTLDINVRSPWKKVAVAASLVNNADLKKVNAKLVIDEKKEYSATATVLVQTEKDIMKIIPEFKVNFNGVVPLTADGLITVEKGKKVMANLKIEKLTATPITLVGSLEKVVRANHLRLNHDLTFTSPLVTMATKGFAEKKAVKFAFRSENSFKFRNGEEHKMIFNTKLHSEKKRDVRIFNLNSNLALTAFPEHNLGIDIEFKRTAVNTKFDVTATFKKDAKPIKFLNDLTLKMTSPLDVSLKSELILPTITLATEHKLTATAPKVFKLFSLTTWGGAKEAKADFTLTFGETKYPSAELKGFLVAPIMPRVDILIRPTLKPGQELELFAEIKHEKHIHALAIKVTREGNALTATLTATVDAAKYELNLKARKMTNLIEISADANLKGKVFGINLSAAIQKTAIKVHTDVTAMKTKVAFNLIGEMTGEAIKAHVDAALADKKIEANIDYLRKGFTFHLLANANGLTHLTLPIGAVALKVQNELAGKALNTLIECKVDEKALLVAALKGGMTADTTTANAKITALETTIAGDFTLTHKDGAYATMINLALPKRTFGFEGNFAGTKINGVAGIKINLNKAEKDNIFEYGLKWTRAAPRDRQQFVGELTMKSPMWLFPVPIKMTALFSKDISNTYKTDLVIDYGLKFEFKAIHKMMPIGIETNIEINTPIEEYEKMTAELVATLVKNQLTFKLAAIHNKKVIEIVLTGKATEAMQEIDFLFKTPFKGMEMITAGIKNKISGMNIDATAELKWGLNKKVAIVFKNTANDVTNVAGKLTIVTPVEKFETTTLEYGFTTKGDTRNLLVRFSWAKDMITELTAVHTFKPDVPMGFVLECLLKVPTIDDLKMIIDFAYKPMRAIEFQLKGMLGAKTVALITKAERTETKIDATLIVKTPENPEGASVKIVFNNPNQGKMLDATLTFTLNPKKVVKAVAYMKKEDWTRTEGKMEFTSFFTDKIAADFGWHFSKAGGILKTNFALEYVPGKKVTVELDSLMKGTEVAFTLKATTPLEPLKLIRYSVKSTGGLENLNTHLEGQFNDMLVSTDLLAKVMNLHDFELSLTIVTPIRTFEKTSLTLSNKGHLSSMTTNAIVLLKGKTWAIEHIIKAVAMHDFELSLMATTPVTAWEKTALTISNKGALKNMATKATLLLNGKTWAIDTTCRLVDLTDMFFGLAVTTPFKKLEKITVELTHKGAWANMITKFVVVTPMTVKTPFILNLVAKIVKPTNMEVKLSLNGLEQLHVAPITISLTNRGETIKPLVTTFSVTVGPKVYTLTSTLDFDGVTNMGGSLVATTPIEKFERVGLTWTNKVADGKKDAKLVVEFMTEQRIVVEGHMMWKGPKLETRLTITTPFEHFDKASFALDFTGVITKFEGIVSVALPKLRTTEIHFSNELDLTTGIVHKSTFRIDCIFFSTTAIETSFELKDKALKLAVKFGYGLKKGTYVLNAKLTKTDAITLALDTALTTDWTVAKTGSIALVVFKGTGMHIKITNAWKFNGVEIFLVNFEHIPVTNGFKCMLTLKQTLIPNPLITVFDITADVELALAKSLIKIVTLVNKAPFVAVEHTHTYTGPTVISKLAVGYLDSWNAETNIVFTMHTAEQIVLTVDAVFKKEKIIDFLAAYEQTKDKAHEIKVKTVFKGKTLIDVIFKLKPDLTNAIVDVKESGRSIFGIQGKVVGHALEAHIVWHDAPLIDLVTEFKPTPLTVAVELKFKGKMIAATTAVVILKETTLEAHITWNKAALIDLKADVKPTPLTFALEIMYKGKMLLTTKNILDLKAKTLSAMLNIDALLKMFIEGGCTWIFSLEGNVVERRDMNTLVLDMKNAEKLIHLELSTKRAGKVDLTLRPANLVVDLKAVTKNLAKDIELAFVMDIKKNADLFKASIVTAINKVEHLKAMVEFTTAPNTKALAANLFFLPLKVNSGLEVTLNSLDALSYKIVCVADKANAKDTTVTISGTAAIKPRAIVFDIKAIIPTRTMVFRIKHVITNSNVEHLVEFSWEAGKTTGYSFTLADRSREGSLIYNLIGEFTHPIRTVKYTAKAEASPRKYLFALDVLPDAALPERKTFFKVDIANDSHGEMINLKGETTFGHPSLEKPIGMTATLTLNRGKILMASSVTIDYSKFDRKRISGTFRIVKESAFHYAIVSEVKQPASFVDIRVNAKIMKTATGALEQTTVVSYMTSKRETRTVTLAIVADLPAKKVEIRLTTPTADRKVIAVLMDKITVEGRHARLVLTHEDVIGKVLTPIIDVELDETSRAFKIEAGQILKVDAGIHDKYMVRLSVVAKGRKILLFKTNFKDATHMLINTRLEWDPVLIETMKRDIPPLAAKVTERLATTWEPIVKEILEDIQTKIAALEEVGMKDLRPVFEAWRKFVRALDKDMTTAIKGLKQMWRRNDFYLKDVGKVVLESWDQFIAQYSKVEAKFWILHKDLIAHLETNHKELMIKLRSLEANVVETLKWVKAHFTTVRLNVEATFNDIKPRVESIVRENLEMAEKKVNEFIAEYEPKVKAMVAQTMKIVGDIRKDIIIPLQAKITAITEELKVKLAPLRAHLLSLLDQVKAKLEEIKASGLATTLTKLQADLEAKYAKTSAAIVAWLGEVNAKFEAAVKEWETYPQVVELKKNVDMIKAKLVWAWTYLDIPGEVSKLVKEAEMRRERFWRIIKENKSGVLVWDEAKGHLEFDVEIPIALKQLATLPTIDDLLARLDTAKREIVAHMPKISWTFMDYYYYWMPRSTNAVDMIPPFTATGIVAGNQHYFTFDGSFVEFAGDCSYVLARDFVDGKFTVIANYRRTRAGPKRNSITVMSGAKNVEIFNTFKTVVDRDVTELPLNLPEATVRRAGQDQIIVESKKGMTVTCHMKTEICTVAISGWYFGKTGGLLGTYDYEPSTDMTNPMGKRLEDVERFANTWEVAKTCSDKTNYAKAFHKVANIESTVAYTTCADLFIADSSVLRPAFRNVDATPFMNMCVNDVFEWQNHPEAAKMMLKKTCTAVAAYIAEAKLRGIMLEAPAHCMSCVGSAKQEMAVGETEKLTTAPAGVDTVVVFEENECNKNKRKDLLGLISNIEKSYKIEGLKHNLFGLTAFGGPGVHNAPHFHTIEGDLMNSGRKFVRGVRAMEFLQETPMNNVEEAIAFAANNYPWRAGVVRNIIVVSCSSCQNTLTPASDLVATLTETKVHVHMLRDLELAFRGGKRASNVLGFDRTGVFTTKDTTVKALAGDATLLAQLAVPKETCIPMIMEAEGSFFTINSFSTGRVREQKKMIQIVAKRVASSSVSASCQICECKVISPYHMKASNVCKPCK